MKRLFHQLYQHLRNRPPKSGASGCVTKSELQYCQPCEYSLNLDATRFSQEGLPECIETAPRNRLSDSSPDNN